MIFNSDQSDHIIAAILETLASRKGLRAEFLTAVELDDDDFLSFVENAQPSCGDVHC